MLCLKSVNIEVQLPQLLAVWTQLAGSSYSIIDATQVLAPMEPQDSLYTFVSAVAEEVILSVAASSLPALAVPLYSL